MHDINHRTAFVAHVNVVSEVDPARVVYARLYHFPGFKKRVYLSGVDVGKLFSVIISNIEIVVQVEEIAGHRTGNGHVAKGLHRLIFVRQITR